MRSTRLARRPIWVSISPTVRLSSQGNLIRPCLEFAVEEIAGLRVAPTRQNLFEFLGWDCPAEC